MPDNIATSSQTSAPASAAPAPAATPVTSTSTAPPWSSPQSAQNFARWDNASKQGNIDLTQKDGGEELVDPDAEPSEDKILDIDDIDPSLKEAPKKEEKVASKPTEQVEPSNPTDQQQQQVNPTDQPPQRDYTQFDDEGKKVLKRAPNAVFAYTEKLNKSLKEIQEKFTQKEQELNKVKEGRIPDSYLDHPEAYTLTPEFRTAAQNHQLDQFEEQHWASQLERIHQGAGWKNLEGYDQQGNPVYKDIPPLKDADGDVIINNKAIVHATQMLQAATQMRHTSATQLQQLVGSYRQLQQQVTSKYTEFEHQSFPGLKELKPELKNDLDRVVKSYPPEIQRNPLAQYIAKGTLLVGAFQQRIKALEAELAKVKPGGVATKQPTQGDFTASGGSQEKMLDIRDFGDI